MKLVAKVGIALTSPKRVIYNHLSPLPAQLRRVKLVGNGGNAPLVYFRSVFRRWFYRPMNGTSPK